MCTGVGNQPYHKLGPHHCTACYSTSEVKTTIEKARESIRLFSQAPSVSCQKCFSRVLCSQSHNLHYGKEKQSSQRKKERERESQLPRKINVFFLSYYDPLESNLFPHHLCQLLVQDEMCNHHSCSKQESAGQCFNTSTELQREV